MAGDSRHCCLFLSIPHRGLVLALAVSLGDLCGSGKRRFRSAKDLPGGSVDTTVWWELSLEWTDRINLTPRPWSA